MIDYDKDYVDNVAFVVDDDQYTVFSFAWLPFKQKDQVEWSMDWSYNVSLNLVHLFEGPESSEWENGILLWWFW